MVKEKYRKKIEEGFKHIFNTETQMGNPITSSNGLTTLVTEPLVKHQIIQLAKLCEDLPVSLTLKSTSNGVSIEFW